MTKEKFAEFLLELRQANANGRDIDAIVKQHEHENAYIYNDGIFKKIFASEKNIALTTDLVNAALNLVGSDRIENPKLVNPFTPGELGYRGIEPDLLMVNDRGQGVPRDRISIEVQHKDYTLYTDRLVLYVARLTSNMAKKGEDADLENLHVVSFQFFDAFPESSNYCHTVQLRNQEQQVYFNKQTVTIVEVQKFFREQIKFANDNSRLAQWLRAIDTLNRDADFGSFSADSMFKVLQNEAKICNFSSRYLMTVDMSDFDKVMIKYEAFLDVAKRMLADGEPVDKIHEYTQLPEKVIRDLSEKSKS